MFKRRDPRTFFQHLRETLWPSQGWMRTFHYYRHRVFRTGDSNYRITAGLASGAAVSFSPFLGTHFFQAIFLAMALRASWISALVGTAWGNPWTFPFMYWGAYILGVWICGLFGGADFVALPAYMTSDYFSEKPWEFITFLFAHPLKLLLPMTVGGYTCAILFWPLAYGILYYPVRTARKAYKRERMRRAYKRAANKKETSDDSGYRQRLDRHPEGGKDSGPFR